MKIVLVTGGFDPIHSGHIEYFKAARELGDKLVVGLNSDDWLIRKKGQPFMPWNERAAIVSNVWKRALERAGQALRTVTILRPSISRHVGLIGGNLGVVCGNRRAEIVILLNEARTRRDKALPKAGIYRERHLILVHLRRHHTSVNATLKGDSSVRVPPWCAFAHGLSLNPLDGERCPFSNVITVQRSGCYQNLVIIASRRLIDVLNKKRTRNTCRVC